MDSHSLESKIPNVLDQSRRILELPLHICPLPQGSGGENGSQMGDFEGWELRLSI